MLIFNIWGNKYRLTHVMEGVLLTSRSDLRQAAMASHGLGPLWVFIPVQRVHS